MSLDECFHFPFFPWSIIHLNTHFNWKTFLLRFIEEGLISFKTQMTSIIDPGIRQNVFCFPKEVRILGNAKLMNPYFKCFIYVLLYILYLLLFYFSHMIMISIIEYSSPTCTHSCPFANSY